MTERQHFITFPLEEGERWIHVNPAHIVSITTQFQDDTEKSVITLVSGFVFTIDETIGEVEQKINYLLNKQVA